MSEFYHAGSGEWNSSSSPAPVPKDEVQLRREKVSAEATQVENATTVAEGRHELPSSGSAKQEQSQEKQPKKQNPFL